MNAQKIIDLKEDLSEVRQSAVVARICGEKDKAECLTGKALGMRHAIALAEKVAGNRSERFAAGELEGIEHVIEALKPIPQC